MRLELRSSEPSGVSLESQAQAQSFQDPELAAMNSWPKDTSVGAAAVSELGRQGREVLGLSWLLVYQE